MPSTQRIRTEVGVDKYINLQLNQDFESLEILSLKILSNDVYNRYCSDYGVVVGRVIVNNGFGVPNARVSVFIPVEEGDLDNPVIAELYPYQNLSSRNEEGYRYNLLSKDPSYDGHRATGTFPNRGDVLMDSSYVEVYDKYYKYTVKTNDSGDFMIFGVPTGDITLVMDVDLSDIGCFSLSPQDLIQQGVATENDVDGANFKTSTNLDSLPQVINLNYDVNVRPFWGDKDLCQIGITRVDFDLTKLANIKIQPSAVFMGSIISTTNDDALSISCKPKNNTGNLCELIAGPGQILSIRQTINSDDQGLPILEVYSLENNGKVIDNDGSFLVNLPMNLDYVFTNEFGEQILSNDPSKGIPTKGKYRFKFKWINKEQSLTPSDFQKKLNEQIKKTKQEYGVKDQDSQNNFQRASFLVPNVKEYGWVKYDDDPLEDFKPGTETLTIIPPATAYTYTYPFDIGLQFDEQVNSSSFSIFVGGQPYYGGIDNIYLPAGTTLEIFSTPVDPNQNQVFTFTRYPIELYNLYRSYTFSLDWDDYVNPQEAINCEDTFYEFNYNKVYTTAMFLDRYKNGIGRARHLGIKEIDDRTCKSTNNTFPVNDIIRNFDPIFFLFNVLSNILIYAVLIPLLWTVHFIAFIWPILKWVLLFLSIRFTVQSIEETANAYDVAQEAVNDVLSMISFTLAGPVIDPGLTPEVIKDALAAVRTFLYAVASVAAGVVFTAFITNAIFDFTTGTWRRLRIPRLGFPMISYPDCTTCECDCKDAELDDDITPQSIQNEIDNQIQQSGALSTIQLAQPKSFLAPINSPGAYNITHPNLQQNPPDSDNLNGGPYWCGFGYRNFQSLTYSFQDDVISADVIIRGTLDYARLFSGYDILNSQSPIKLTTNEKYLLHAPQPFLWSANKPTSLPISERWFAYPMNATYPQRLNEFNTRDKYFGASAPNRVKIQVNNSPQTYEDQVIVLLANPGTSVSLIPGIIFTFQDPQLSNCWVNLTGATFNEFGTNSVTGNTFTGQTQVTVPYANPNNSSGNLSSSITITATSETGVASTIPGVPGLYDFEESYLKYPIDLEYFQVVTGMTVGDFINASNTGSVGLFPRDYLLHRIKYLRPNCNTVTPGSTGPRYTMVTTTPALQNIPGYQNLEIIIIVRGVDPHTQKQYVSYDLSKIFGYTTTNNNTIVAGQYYLNRPIQGYTTTPNKPKSHLTVNNQGHNIYFPSYTFSIGAPTPSNPNFTAFTSTLPYYYLATDDSVYSNYKPVPFFSSSTGLFTPSSTNGLVPATTNTVPYYSNTPSINSPQLNTYIGGAAFIGSTNNLSFNTVTQFNSPFYNPIPIVISNNKDLYFYFAPPTSPSANFKNLNALYSPAYYRTYSNSPINFSDRTRIVMRSDRLPTSTMVENGLEPNTGYGLHQNNNFIFYNANGDQAPEQILAGLDIVGGTQADLDPFTSAITETLQCENMVSLQCYSGSGTNISVIPPDQCPIPEGRVVKGCYCLLQKGDEIAGRRWYLIGNAFKYDAALLLEWKVRFTLNFAACRGVFAQVFQNNWVNGALYMFSFNSRKFFGLDPNNPNQTNRKFYKKYCDDVIVYNDITNNFYYRSSPWNDTTQEFVGKESPDTSGFANGLLKFPGAGYNRKQIQFPTTIVDLGPRDGFISQICSNPSFGSYYANQMNTTSYQDNSDILQLSFLSRILNEQFRDDMRPTVFGNNVKEGVGIKNFFDSKRGGERIDGDIAQMLSINSEWKVSPFISENIPGNNYIFFGSQGTSNNPTNPVFGVFFSSSTQELRYRKIMSPGVETYSISPLIEQSFGYPKSQVVPNYKWSLSGGSTIFGTEDNNWFTESVNTNSGFFKKQYQDVNFVSTLEKYLTSNPSINFGFITNFTNASVPTTSPLNVIQGVPGTGLNRLIVVGAPYYFYFGLINGNTAVDKFFKLYVAD